MALLLLLLAVIWICLILAWWGNLAKKRQKRSRLSGTMPARDLRRSRRLILSVPVFVYGWATDNNPFTDFTNTFSVSLHGGLIALPATVRPGEMVLLANIYTNEEKQCRIVRVGPEHDGKRDAGFEFLHPEGWFWWTDVDS
jgi:hypothetical protein